MAMVALVEDDADVRVILSRLLAALGYAVVAFPTAEAFLAALAAQPPRSVLPWHCLLTDLHLPGRSGLSLLYAIQQPDQQGLPVILMSGKASPALQQEALTAGAVAVLDKPLDLDALKEALENALTRGASPD
jgi:FixJ family two-component response regulator